MVYSELSWPQANMITVTQLLVFCLQTETTEVADEGQEISSKRQKRSRAHTVEFAPTPIAVALTAWLGLFIG